MSQESDASDSPTGEVVTYTVDTLDYPCNAPSTEDRIQSPKPKKRKMNTKTVKIQHDNNCPPLKTFVYCKSYYRQQVRSLFKLMNGTCKLETKVLSAAGAFLTTTDECNMDNGSSYFPVLGRRFQTFANIQ